MSTAMQPSGFDVPSEREQSVSGRASHMVGSAGRSTSDIPRFRSEESWIEIASQPSSSSLSSSATDEIVTTGLHVQHDVNNRRRRRAHRSIPRGAHFSLQARSSAGSSQEEYEESESDEDRVMTSSNENLRTSSGSHLAGRPAQKLYGSDSEEADDDDENSTALGVGNNYNVPFAPQPNAFSHPPSSQSNSGNYISNPSSRHTSLSHTQRGQHSANSSRRPQPSHNPYIALSPTCRADHDAALRASLSTLLSCAAAARGLPKQSQSPPRRRGSSGGLPATTIEQGTLRIVPESVVMGEGGQDNENPDDSPELSPARSKSRRNSSTSTTSSASCNIPSTKPAEVKRKSTTTLQSHPPKANSRITKKPRVRPSTITNTRTSEISFISPTLFTWAISAGVVVLVSAISFSAGYAMGREIGRREVSGFFGGGDTGGDREEVVMGGLRGLKRLRFGGTGGKVVA